MLLDKLKQRFGATILAAESAHGQETIVVTRERALELMRALRDEPDFGFNFLADLTAVDWVERTPRFEVVYHLRALGRGGALRVKVGAGEPDLWVYSVTGLWKSADWLERECYDMFGIRFEGHPDLRRILLYDSFEGHPLRKDYPVNRRQPMVPETDPILNPLRPSR
ncbi:MAG TPA: NADH-quinone oxidoreductase subunit C [Candidatus Binataceae bacterium]|jgi:NADH-quinone oxidoreductase subunit C|nr:NADH-quinone oxidoreductase subunit C [Candidatus Binataceae bacterium]